MPGLKKHHADVRFSGNKVTPDEVDMRQRYVVTYPSIGASTLGTAAAGTVNVAWTAVNTILDYPRTVLFSVTGGTTGGTTIINGNDQFNRSVTETITIATAAAGGTVAGTKIFDSFSSGTYYPAGGDNTSTAVLGYAKGTAAATRAWFGLPVKIKATGDVKRITWINNGTQTDINGGTIAAYVDTAQHAIRGTAIVAATDIYIVDVLSTYTSENDANVG